MPVVESSGGVRGVVAHWWAGLGPQYTKLQQCTKISSAQCRSCERKKYVVKGEFCLCFTSFQCCTEC